MKENTSRRSSHLSSSIYSNQQEKDRQAYDNTRKVLHEHQEIRKHYRRWVPQSINSENALFSQAMPKHKPMKKQSKPTTLSINIFQMPGDFKPCVKRTELSVRNSNLFTESQSGEHWRSSSKRVEVKDSREFVQKQIFRDSQDHAAKKSSIDLSWGSGPVQCSRSTIRSQGKSIYNNLHGSSIKL